MEDLMAEILMQASDLCRHGYAHHVMEHFLEHGMPEHKATIVSALLQDLDRNTRNRHASYVIEKALEHASPQDVLRLERALVADLENFLDLATNQFGCHVVITLIRQDSDAAKMAHQVLHNYAPRLQDAKFGAKVMQELASLPM